MTIFEGMGRTCSGEKPLRYDAVLYDFDGTLVDTIPMILECYQRAFMEVTGQEEDETFLLSQIGLPLASTFVKYDPTTQQALLEAYYKHNMILLPTHVSVFEGIMEGLEEVRSLGVLQGLVTSKRSETALITMRQFDMVPFFDALVFREDTQVHKPNPMPVYLAMEKLGIKDASRVLFVGDSIHDLRCAANAGVDSVAVHWTYMPEEELMAENPTYWIHRLSDLSCILTVAEL
jgi:pyrophosphatase PpaX